MKATRRNFVMAVCSLLLFTHCNSSESHSKSVLVKCISNGVQQPIDSLYLYKDSSDNLIRYMYLGVSEKEYNPYDFDSADYEFIPFGLTLYYNTHNQVLSSSFYKKYKLLDTLTIDSRSDLTLFKYYSEGEEHDTEQLTYYTPKYGIIAAKNLAWGSVGIYVYPDFDIRDYLESDSSYILEILSRNEPQ